MKALHFQPDSHQRITELTRRVSKRDPNPFLTFIFTTEHVYLIGGQTEHLLMITLDNIDQCECAAWSISASAFASFWTGQEHLIIKKNPILLRLNIDEASGFLILEGITENHSYRYAQALPACEVHRHFFDVLTTRHYQSIETSKAKMLCKLADEYHPYQVFEINKDTHEVRIERDNDILPFPLPPEMSVEFSMALTPEAKCDLERLAHATRSDTLSIFLDDEHAIFSDEDQVYSHSLAPLRAYRDKQQQHFTQEAKMIVTIFTFKDERDAFQTIDEIKQANQVLIYFTQTKVYLAGIPPVTGTVMLLSQTNLITTGEQLYSINLSLLSKVPIKDITSVLDVN